MRFKTRLRVGRIAALLRVVQALQKVDRRCILHLTPQEDDQIRLILFPTALSSVAAYTGLPKSYWFDGYRIESQSGNNIGMEVDLQNLDRALKSAAGGDAVVIKLAKKGVPVLTFDIRTALGPILQDLPVSIMSSTRLEECQEPDSATLQGVVLPSLANLCSVVERLKALGNHASIKTVVGERSSFTIEAASDAANLSASYDGIEHARHNRQNFSAPTGYPLWCADEINLCAGLEVEPSSSMGDARECEVELEVKNFGKALFAHQILPDQVLCCKARLIFSCETRVHN
uniref:Checkpoint protein n=1 Tax=Rhodosorus marinus TaxID=101924 RepID=A0A7S3A7K8_9RHOD|mmetsp:Transcript_4684/g.20052  ORF Transcript_4684/g.20052 Transcript_4684/m.20052 type:complete len:288 (+) Transcript_4684:713-1576(+)